MKKTDDRVVSFAGRIYPESRRAGRAIAGSAIAEAATATTEDRPPATMSANPAKEACRVSDLGRTLRRLRKSMRMSIYDVERRTGLHFSTISKYERNERLPSLQVLKELAELYGVSLGSLVAEESEGGLAPDLVARARAIGARPDLADLFDLAEEMTADQVSGLTAMLRSIGSGRRPRREPSER